MIDAIEVELIIDAIINYREADEAYLIEEVVRILRDAELEDVDRRFYLAIVLEELGRRAADREVDR